ncbi:MAG TPA: ABC transporter permease [Gammaproteobacteria bacterium]|nr:ABC transporter permease [Gammaproteobacteria bacterium]
MPVFALIGKEWKLLLRDWHALLLLFAMPAVFILVMSLALQDQFAAHQRVNIHYYLVDEDQSAVSRALVQQLDDMKDFSALPSGAPVAKLLDLVRNDRTQFLVRIPAGFGKAMLTARPSQLEMRAGPGVEPAMYELFAAALRSALAHVYLRQLMAPLDTQPPVAGSVPAEASGLSVADKLLNAQSLYQAGSENQRPSSVQQNVPAWLLFAMFFIAIPLSTTWVQERQQGTYARLRSMGVRPGDLLLGKLLPYLGINLLQVALMLAIGVFVVPLLGGGRLALGHSPLALCLMALAVSFASVAYALLIANMVTTSEQATIFTGVANLLMAAIGGIMVPRFLMPAAMQTLSQYSPMAWGLEGFLDVFLRQGGLGEVVPEAARLFGFGLICLLVAGILLGARQRK